jgi:hypothetical protein
VVAMAAVALTVGVTLAAVTPLKKWFDGHPSKSHGAPRMVGAGHSESDWGFREVMGHSVAMSVDGSQRSGDARREGVHSIEDSTTNIHGVGP